MNPIKLFGDEFYFARHGQTDNNRLGLITGELDIPLNAAGIQQAESMAGIVSRLAIVSCVCSPMIRAIETANLLLANISAISPLIFEKLDERHWGKLAGASKIGLNNLLFDEMGVERWEYFAQRTMNALADIVDLATPTLIVAHSGTFRIICEYLNITIDLKSVQNAYPYRFYKTDNIWKIDL